VFLSILGFKASLKLFKIELSSHFLLPLGLGKRKMSWKFHQNYFPNPKGSFLMKIKQTLN